MRMWLSAGLLAVLVPPAAAQDGPELPGWMAGCWEQVEGTRWTEECWTTARGGMMLGSSRSAAGDRVDQWETMRIVLDAEDGGGAGTRMTFHASPNGGTPTVFEWRPSDQPGISFTNPAHDYPQRIRYWRDGEELLAEISMADGSKPRRWRYRRTGG